MTFQKVLFLAALAPATLHTACVRETPEKPNILVFISDDLSYRALGYNNYLDKINELKSHLMEWKLLT